MIEELELVKQMVGDFTNVGIWGFVSYIAFLLVKLIISWGALAWLLNKMIVGTFNYLSLGESKAGIEEIKKENQELKIKLENSESMIKAAETRADAAERERDYKIDEVQAKYYELTKGLEDEKV